MTGSIISKGKDTWKIVVSMGTSPDCKRLRHIETIHGKKSAAQGRIRELLTLKDKGIITPKTKLTLAEHLKNWLAGPARVKAGSRTIEGYTSIVEIHIIPALGHYQLRQLNAQSISAYYTEAQKNGLKPRTVHKHHRLLFKALKWAVRQGYIGRNPIELVDAPAWPPKEMRSLTESEVLIFLDAARPSLFYPVYYTALSTGLRQSELCGLLWRDLDLDCHTLSVNRVLYKRRVVCERKAPKTKYSRRQIKLTDKLVEYLKEYRAERESFYLHLGEILTPDDYVFGIADKPCDPSALSHDFAIIAKRAGLKDVRFHDLRHTMASLALARGASSLVISKALGHASVAFTLQTYAHVIGDMQEEAMGLLNDALPEGILQTGTKLTP